MSERVRNRNSGLDILKDLKALEYGWPQRQGWSLPGTGMRGPEFFRSGPADESIVRRPDGMRGIKDVIFHRRPTKKLEADKSGHGSEQHITIQPFFAKSLFAVRPDPEAVHGNIHRGIPIFSPGMT